MRFSARIPFQLIRGDRTAPLKGSAEELPRNNSLRLPRLCAFQLERDRLR
jgi:hypothetical protein